MERSSDPHAASRLRWYQFRLRSLLLLTLLVAVLCGTVLSAVMRMRRQEELITGLKKHGLSVSWNVTGNITGIHFSNYSVVTDDELKVLKLLPRLEFLSIISPNLTDLGLEHLRAVTTLTAVTLYDTQITDGGLQQLRDMPNLQEIGLLHNPAITEEGIQRLHESLPGCSVRYVLVSGGYGAFYADGRIEREGPSVK